MTGTKLRIGTISDKLVILRVIEWLDQFKAAVLASEKTKVIGSAATHDCRDWTR